MIEENAAENTDTRLWKDESGFQEVFVTREGAIGINHAGQVAVKTVPEWIKAVWSSDGDLPVPDKPDTGKNADETELAIKFHETYERLAPQFGYETRTETRQFDPTSKNGRLMIAVCAELRESLTAERDDLRRQLANAEYLENLCDRLRQEAEIHAQEARTANATIAEIYQLVTGATGEPGNWNGAEPVREKLASLTQQLQAEWDRAAQTLEALRAAQTSSDGATTID